MTHVNLSIKKKEKKKGIKGKQLKGFKQGVTWSVLCFAKISLAKDWEMHWRMEKSRKKETVKAVTTEISHGKDCGGLNQFRSSRDREASLDFSKTYKTESIMYN